MMPARSTYLALADTNAFSNVVQDYATAQDTLKPYYAYAPDDAGVAEAIEARKKFEVARPVLVAALLKQYGWHGDEAPRDSLVHKNIMTLLQPNTYTVCTAHQPNLLTGYLYFIYKILHAIKLAQHLNALHADKHFVPVYYMGSEDNDLDELGVFAYEANGYVWDGAGQQGAVGSMCCHGVPELLSQLYRALGPPGNYLDELKTLLNEAYQPQHTIAEATKMVVHHLTSRYGLVVLNPNEPELKRLFITEMEDDLLRHTNYNTVMKTMESWPKNYKAQAAPRAINLFYLRDNLRERIERKQEDEWVVLNTRLKWTRQELLQELHAHPERFSPNVIMRGLYQEKILPNVAFIGGGAEIAYWLQLKAMFERHNLFFPALILRQSILLLKQPATTLISQLGFKPQHLFLPVQDLQRAYLLAHAQEELQLDDLLAQIKNSLEAIAARAYQIDTNLKQSSEAAKTKMLRPLYALQQKMLKAEKRKHTVSMQRIEKLKRLIYPNGKLQERHENFLYYYPQYGQLWIDELLNTITPYGSHFLVLNLDNNVVG